MTFNPGLTLAASVFTGWLVIVLAVFFYIRRQQSKCSHKYGATETPFFDVQCNRCGKVLGTTADFRSRGHDFRGHRY